MVVSHRFSESLDVHGQFVRSKHVETPRRLRLPFGPCLLRCDLRGTSVVMQSLMVLVPGLGNDEDSYGKSPLFNGKIHYQWADFHSYVDLPEGT